MSIVRRSWLTEIKPAIGMLHLPALPGSPGCQDSLQHVLTHTLRDAETLIEGGMDGLILENFGDTPFYPDHVPPVTVAAMTRVAVAIRDRFHVPLGINVLRNDALSALAVAIASGANFIRVNVLCGARVTDQGIIQGNAHMLLRERYHLGAEDIQIWADVQVKHSGPIAPRSLIDEVNDTIQRGQADAVIVSGSATSSATAAEDVSQAKQVAGPTPVLVGSGVNFDNLSDYLAIADGVIVGSSLQESGRPGNPVDPERVKRFVDVLRRRV